MRRREFITLLGGAAATWPLAARAQQAAMPVVGFLNNTSPEANADLLRAFRQGLKDTGFVEGENVAVDYRWADNQLDRLPALATDLVHRRAAVIVTTGGITAASAAKAATATIPIAFVVGEDPVRVGLVASLARPGGNLTGINFLTAELGAKRLGRVAVLVNPVGPNAEATVKDVETGGPCHGTANPAPQRQHQRRDQCSLCIVCARAVGYASCWRRSLFYQPAQPDGPIGGAPLGPRDIFGTSISRNRRTDELRSKPNRCVSSSRRLCRSHS